MYYDLLGRNDKYETMLKKLSHEEYQKTLPRKTVGTAVILFNNTGELLIVKPNYKDGWLVPGGSNDEGESPLQCAIRETKEEIGLDIPEMRLVGVLHSAKREFYSDSLKFIFFGGTLTDDQISQIQLQKKELEEYTFKTPAEAIPLLSSSLKNSVPACLQAIKEGTVAYLDA